MGKYKRLKRELAVLLSACMVLGMTPISVRAEEKVSENIVQTGETASEKDVQIETETVSEKAAQTEAETVPEKAVQIEAETVSEKAAQTEADEASEKTAQTEVETVSEKVVQTETETASENIVQTAAENASNTVVQAALGESSDVYELTLENGAYYDSQRVKYTLSTKGGVNTATVSGYDTSYVNDTTFPAANVEDGNGWEIVIPAKVSLDGMEYAVTEIGMRAFNGCTQLTKTKFSGNTAVKKIDVEAFGFCSLESITLPDSLASIDHFAFRNNTRLKYIYIPKNVSEIGYAICFACTVLTEIEISPENEKYYIEDASNCIIDEKILYQGCSTSVLPKDKNITINSYAFGNMDITKVDFTGVHIEKIMNFAFQESKLPENWVLPSSSGSLAVSQLAFYASNGLKKVTIPDNVYIEKYSHTDDDALNTDFGSSIFSKCNSLEQVVIPKTLKLASFISGYVTNYDFFRGCDSENLTAYVEAGADDYLMTALKNYAKQDWTGGKTTPTTNENGHFILKDAYRVQLAEEYEGYTLAKTKDCATLVPIPGDSATFTITADEEYKSKPIVKVGEPGLATEQIAALSPVSYDETKGGYTITVDKDHYVVYLENYGKCGHSGKSTYTLQNDKDGNSILTKVCDECGNVETGAVTAVWRHGIRQADSIAFSCDNINMKGTFAVSEDVVDSKDTYSYKFTPTDGSCTGTGSVTVTNPTEENFGHTTNGITYSTVKSENDINTQRGNCSVDIYYDSEQSILYINGSETYVVSGTTKIDRIVVNNMKPTTLVLNGIDIQMTDLPAIDLQGTADVKLVLADEKENTLESTGNYAALQKNDLASDTPKLIIDGMGSLSASAKKGAAIGAETKKTSSNIIVDNGHITAKSSNGSGIGNGSDVKKYASQFSPEDFIFNGGEIRSECEEAIDAYDISGGITINGGAVYIGIAPYFIELPSGCNKVNEGFMSRYSRIVAQCITGIKGNVTVDLQFCGNGLEIPENTTLTIGDNGRMYTEKGTVTNRGTLIIKGSTTNLDSLQNNGTIYNYSRSNKSLADKVTGSGTFHEDIDHDGLCDICEAHEDIGNVTISDYTKAVTITQGGTLTLSAAVTPKESGNGKAVTYEWYQLGTDGSYTKIKDAATAEYTQDSSSLEPGKYTYRLQALCDGIIRYIPFTVTVKEKINIQYNTHSITLGDYIGVNFYVTIPEAARTEAAYMEFSVSGRGGENTKIKLSDITAEKDGRYKFTCQVNAIEMAETVTAVFHYGENETAGNTYSVRKYIETIMADGSQPDYVKNMVRALADYGYYAQRCLAETNGWELDKDYAQMLYYTADIDTTADLSAYAYSCEGEVPGITGVKRSLSLDSKTAINLYFTIDDSLTEAPAVVVKNAEGNAVDYELTLVNNGSRYRLTIPEIYAHKLGEVYTITVNDTMTIRTSALSYAYAVLQSEQMTAAAKKAVAAMYQYYQAAIAYQKMADYTYSVK